MDASSAISIELPTPAPIAMRRSPPFARRLKLFGNAPGTQVRRFAPREAIFKTGESAQQVHTVLRGVVMVSQRLPDGRRQVVDMVGVGGMFGLAAEDRYDCRSEAVTDCVVGAVPRDVISGTASLRLKAHEAMEGELRRMRALLSIHARKSAVERVAAFLLLLAGPSRNATTIYVPLTRSEIADFIGLTTESVSRCFASLRRTGVFGHEKGGRLDVADWPRLREISLGQDFAPSP